MKKTFDFVIKNIQCHVFDKVYFLCFTFLFIFVGFTQVAYANKPYTYDTKLQSGSFSEPLQSGAWRIRIFDSAVVKGNKVLLREIGEPVGQMPPQLWQELSKKELWESPPEKGKPFKISKANLINALRNSLGMYADSCLVSNAIVIQRGGDVVREDRLRKMAVQYLTPQLNKLGGRTDLTDFRLPPYIFVSNNSQNLVLEPTIITPGRVNLKYAIQELDGKIVRRFSGTVFVNVWVDTPATAKPMAKGETLLPKDITHKSVNLAYESKELWDGRGGPWQITRPMGALEPISTTDLKPLSAIKKGDKVNLVYSKNGIHLSVTVEAMEDGALGDTILVRNLDSKKQVYGMIQDQNTIIVK